MATGDSSTALGILSTASGLNSTALGRASTAAFANSTAIGNESATTRDNQMVLGTASNTYTARGITSDASTAAQTGPRELVTTDASGNLASATPSALGLASSGDLDDTTAGVAMSMALTRIPCTLPENASYGLAVGAGTFRGESGMAVGGTTRLSDHLFLNGGATFGSGSGNNTGGAVGMAYIW